MAAEALQLHIDGLLEDGEEIPDPSSLTSAMTKAKKSRAMALMMVAARLPGRSRRIDITVDDGLLEDIKRAASAAGMSRSAFFAEGARRMIGGYRRSST